MATARELNGFRIIDVNGWEWNSEKHGVYVIRKSIPLFASVVENTEKILGRDGLYDFGTEYENREISVDVVVKGNSVSDRIAKVAEITRILDPKRGFQRLYFKDRPDVYYLVKINASIEQDVNQHKDLSFFTLTFTAKPYAYKDGTEAVFSGDSNNIEMNIATRSDVDVPFRMEICGNTNIKPNEFWDLKDSSKNLIPNPRFLKNGSGDVVKWHISGEFESQEEFLKKFGYQKTYPTFSDTQQEFIEKVKNGTYKPTDFSVKIDYEADANGYLVQKYHYFLDNFEIYTTQETVSSTNWLGNDEFSPKKIIEDIVYIFRTLLSNAITISSYLSTSCPYMPYNWFVKDVPDILCGNKTNDWFLSNSLKHSLKIENNRLIENDIYCAVKEGRAQVKELQARQWFTPGKTYEIYDVIINGILVWRGRKNYEPDRSFPNESRWPQILRSGTSYMVSPPILYHFGIPTTFIKENFAMSEKPASKCTDSDVWSQCWSVENNVIQIKNPFQDASLMNENSSIKIQLETLNDYGIYYNYFLRAYVNGVLVYTGFPARVFFNTEYQEIKNGIDKIATAMGISNNLTLDDYKNSIIVAQNVVQGEYKLYTYVFPVVNGVLQPPVQIANSEMDAKITEQYYDVGHKLNYGTTNYVVPVGVTPIDTTEYNTISISFVPNEINQIPHNKIQTTLQPFFSQFNTKRFKYVYSDIIGIEDVDLDYVMSVYQKGTGYGSFGIIVLDNNEQYVKKVFKSFQTCQDFVRDFFTEHLTDTDLKIVVFFEFTNEARESDEYIVEVALPQLEKAPLSAWTENGTLYSLTTTARKNLIDNAGFKFSVEGRMDRWGFYDGSAGMIQKNYTASDLPKDIISGKNIGYGAVEFMCSDTSENTYSSYLYQELSIGVKNSTAYTFSAYVKSNVINPLGIQTKLVIIERDIENSVVAQKEKIIDLQNDWIVSGLTVTTTANTTSAEVRLVVEKMAVGLAETVTVKFAAVQFEENSATTKWEDDNWESSYVVVSKNLLYNPAFGVVAGESLPEGWSLKAYTVSGTANTTVTVIENVEVAGDITNAVHFDVRTEGEENDYVCIESRPIPIRENRYYALSFFVRGKVYYVEDPEVDITNRLRAKIVFLDDTGVVVREFEDEILSTAQETFLRRHFFPPGGNALAPTGATRAVVQLGYFNTDTHQVAGHLDIVKIQLEEVPAIDSLPTAWEDNFTFSVKPTETPSTIKPVYIKNPKIYRQDGSLFFAWTGTMKNTEKLVFDTEKFQAYIQKENGTKVSILDDVFVFIYNKLPKQITDTNTFYLRYTDESGNDENTQKPVQVSVKFSWTAKTF